MDFLRDVLLVLWVFIPAGVANMVPIFAAHMTSLKKFTAPIDGGRSFRGKRIFGPHKTWRGLLTGIVAAIFMLGLQQVLVRYLPPFAWIADGVDYSFAALPTVIVGALFAIGALGGDAIKSFFKRQVGVAPGKSWFPFDQLDYIIGGALAVMPFIQLDARQYLLLVLFWLGIHVLSTWLGWLMRLKDSPI